MRPDDAIRYATLGTSAERGKAMMKKKAYVKPQLRKLGLLRNLTMFSF
jgi:hypothetical protein